MPVRSDEPLRKVTLNLYETDCEWMEKNYGHGWTERLRQLLNFEVHKHKHPVDYHLVRRTLGDLE
jgi:hypothetical protein